MNNRDTIKNELNELNSQLPFEKGPEVYSVPQGYFEGFAASVLERLKTENTSSASQELKILAPFLARIPKTMPFSVPEGYFTHTTEELSDWVKEDNLPEILQSGKDMPYQVPLGYFETLSGILLKRVNPTTAKVIPISSARKWMRYAVAAIIAGAIGISSILYFGNNQSVDPASQPHEWVETKLKNVPDQAIEEFINTTDVSTTAMAKTRTMDKTEVRRLLKDIPDTELDKFLNEISIDNDELSAYN